MSTWGARIGLAGIVVAGLLFGAACGADSAATDKATPAAGVATTAAGAQTAAAATSSATRPAQTRTFTDDSGKSFTVATPPKRVVALSPSVVEIMYAVGAPPLARPSSANFPEQAKSLPAIGSSYQPSFEQIAAQTPDFLIADAQLQGPQTVTELQKLGVPVFVIRVQSVEDVTKYLRTVGAIMGKTEEGDRAAKEIEGKIQAAQAKLPAENQRPRVFILVGTADAFFAAKPNSFSGDVIARLGAKNAVGPGPDSAGAPAGFSTFSLEKLIELDPDVVLVVSVAGPNAPPTSRQLAGNPAWAGLRAVKGGRVHEVPADELVQSAGPRVGAVIDQFVPILYPNR